MTIAAKYALGTRGMLLCAIHEHCRTDELHSRPRRFELHPEVICSLQVELDASEFHYFRTENPDRMRFHGVDIVADRQATRPKMITADNKVEYL